MGIAIPTVATAGVVLRRERSRARLLDTQEQAAASRFRLALDSLPDLVAIQRSVRDESGQTVDFVFEFVNYPDLPVGDMTRRDLVGRRMLDVLPGLAGSPVFKAMVEVADTRKATAVEDTPVVIQASDEPEQRYATTQVAPFDDGVIAVVRDVSERQRHLRSIEQAHDELHAAQQLAHIGVWRVELDIGEMTLSDEAARIIGRAEGGVMAWEPGMLLDLVDPSDRERVAELIGSAGGGSFVTEADLRVPDGPPRRVAVVGQFVAPGDDNEAVVWGTIQDITEQRRQERALRDARDHLEQERAMIEQLQLAIVPTLPDDGLEAGAAYRPAGDASLVGGDWYDAFAVGDRRLVLAIGDVAGHGLPAAALMGQLRNATRGVAFADHGPDEVLAVLNRLIFEAGVDELATCVVGSFDRHTSELCWSSAGHPPALVVQAGVGATYLDGPVAALLGFSRATGYGVTRTTLEPGTTLVLYSDGLIERRGESLDVGLERLARAAAAVVDASPQELCDRLVDVMVSETDQRDDVCVLAFRVPPRAEPGTHGTERS